MTLRTAKILTFAIGAILCASWFEFGWIEGQKHRTIACVIPPTYWEPKKPVGILEVGYFCVLTYDQGDKPSSKCVWKILEEK